LLGQMDDIAVLAVAVVMVVLQATGGQGPSSGQALPS
jgi:uncharacterized membrane protein YkvA (DUF1232 family)